MTYFPKPNSVTRATRVKLGGQVQVVIRSEVTGNIRGNLYLLSATGGSFIVAKPLELGDFVQLKFQTSKGPVRGMAEMLKPTRQSKTGCLQPFRFVALEDEDHTKLRMAMESLHDQIGASAGKAHAL